MRDIAGAIAAEQQYIQDRIENGYDVSIYDYLAPYGYFILEEYSKDKKDYELKTLNIDVHLTDMLNIEDRVEANVIRKIPSIFIPTADKTFAWIGERDVLDTALFSEYEIQAYNMRYLGGTIISGPEDFSIAIITPDTIDICSTYYMERICDFLRQYFPDAHYDRNDIMVNDRKVAGTVMRRVDGMLAFAMQVSFVDRTDMINILCPPHGDKIPGCIDSTILNKTVLQNEILSWFKEE